MNIETDFNITVKLSIGELTELYGFVYSMSLAEGNLKDEMKSMLLKIKEACELEAPEDLKEYVSLVVRSLNENMTDDIRDELANTLNGASDIVEKSLDDVPDDLKERYR